MRIFIAVVALTIASAAAGEQGPDAEAHAKIIAPFLDSSTVAVVRFDLDKPDGDELASLLTLDQPLSGIQSILFAREIKSQFATLRLFGAKEVYALFNLGGSTAPVFVVPLPDLSNRKGIDKLLAPNDPYLNITAKQIGAAVVIGPKAACKHYQNLKPVPRPELAKAFAPTNGMTCQIALILSPEARRAVEELVPSLPPELGGGSSKVLTRGMQWAAIGLNGSPRMSLHVVVQATNEPEAGPLSALMRAAFKAWAKETKAKDADKVAAALEPIKTGDKLFLTLDHDQVAPLIRPLIARSLFDEARKQVALNLELIAKCMHLYHDLNKSFPTPANYDKEGKPLLSWRVHLLPWLDQEALYAQFKLDEPWDSQHNKQLIAKIPPIYRHVLGKGVSEGKTPFVVPIGKDTIFPGGKGVALRDITDGTSCTVLVLEAADDHMVVWTQPEDWPFDPKQVHRGLVDKSRPTFMAAFADGSVHVLKNELLPDVLRALMTRNGGEAVYSGDLDKVSPRGEDKK